MAKKVRAVIKLQVPGGKATPAPPVGPALGQHGVNADRGQDERESAEERHEQGAESFAGH